MLKVQREPGGITRTGGTGADGFEVPLAALRSSYFPWASFHPRTVWEAAESLESSPSQVGEEGDRRNCDLLHFPEGGHSSSWLTRFQSLTHTREHCWQLGPHADKKLCHAKHTSATGPLHLLFCPPGALLSQIAACHSLTPQVYSNVTSQ